MGIIWWVSAIDSVLYVTKQLRGPLDTKGDEGGCRMRNFAKTMCLIAVLLLTDNVMAEDVFTFTPSVEKIGDSIKIKTRAGGWQIIPLGYPFNVNDISLEDVNFDRFADIEIQRTSGNVEKFSNIYLYDESRDGYIFSAELSKVPCLEVDKKEGQLIGACFHASACENWSERYSIGHINHLHLVSREGTYCDQSSGETFSYVDSFEDGRRVSSKVTLLANTQCENRQEIDAKLPDIYNGSAKAIACEGRGAGDDGVVYIYVLIDGKRKETLQAKHLRPAYVLRLDTSIRFDEEGS